MSFVVKINSDNLSLGLNHKEITLKSGENAFVTFEAKAKNNNKDIYYSMSAVGDSTKNSDGIDGKITLAESPTLTQYVLRDDILSQTTRDYTITVPENTLVSRSSYEISLSNNPIQHLESIISSLLIYPYGCIEQSVSTTVPNVMAKKFAQYFTNSKIDIKKSEEQTKVGLARIASMQVDNGGFAYWQGSSSADLHITPYVLRSLIEMRDLGAPVDQTMIDRTINYLTNELTNPSDNTQKTEIFQALARAGKGQLAYDIYFSNTEIAKELTRHERIAYLYGLFLTDKTKYRELIKTNIELVKKDFSTTKNDNYWENWYWNQDSDKAIFASFLMDANYDEIYVTKIIKELSSKDYVTYYMSTQSKNAAFGAFIKYIEKYGKNRTSNVQITLGDAIQDVTLSGNG